MIEPTATCRLVVASTNPVKLRAATEGFRRIFPELDLAVRGVAVPSGVAQQPLSDAETLAGARQRADAARELAPEADFWVGLEGGVEPCGDELAAFAWAVVRSPERSGRARSATFLLPPGVAALVHAGLELGEADDRVFGREGSKREGGAVGLLTGEAIDRAGLYAPAVSLALIPFRNPGLYPAGGTAASAGSPLQGIGDSG